MASIPFPLFRRFGRGIKRSYSKNNPKENKNSKKIWYKIIKVKKDMNLKYQFDSFTPLIVAGVSSALVV